MMETDVVPRLVPKTQLKQAARRFRLLGDISRLELLNLLYVLGELNVQDLVAATGQSQPRVSRHLGLLAKEGMVRGRRSGTHVYYRIIDPALSGICLLMCAQLQRMDG